MAENVEQQPVPEPSIEELQKEVKEKGKKASRKARMVVLQEARKKNDEAVESEELLRARKKMIENSLEDYAQKTILEEHDVREKGRLEQGLQETNEKLKSQEPTEEKLELKQESSEPEPTAQEVDLQTPEPVVESQSKDEQELEEARKEFERNAAENPEPAVAPEAEEVHPEPEPEPELEKKISAEEQKAQMVKLEEKIKETDEKIKQDELDLKVLKKRMRLVGGKATVYEALKKEYDDLSETIKKENKKAGRLKDELRRGIIYSIVLEKRELEGIEGEMKEVKTEDEVKQKLLEIEKKRKNIADSEEKLAGLPYFEKTKKTGLFLRDVASLSTMGLLSIAWKAIKMEVSILWKASWTGRIPSIKETFLAMLKEERPNKG